MFLEEKSDSVAHFAPTEESENIYTLMRSYIEYSCRQSRTFTSHQDIEGEIEDRLARIFS